jgi:hypothetical protein
MKEFWDERYRNSEYVYGESPNLYFQGKLDSLKPGKILLPADGEGRNGVYASTKGWDVHCFDQSKEGQSKALRLAEKKAVRIKYDVCDFSEFQTDVLSFDCIALIYVHFPLDVQISYHNRLLEYLKTGGYIVLEAFHKDHLEYQKNNPNIGGPKDPSMLYSLSHLEKFFPGLKILEQYEVEVNLSEGQFHQGLARVLRFFAQKI